MIVKIHFAKATIQKSLKYDKFKIFEIGKIELDENNEIDEVEGINKRGEIDEVAEMNVNEQKLHNFENHNINLEPPFFSNLTACISDDSLLLPTLTDLCLCQASLALAYMTLETLFDF